MKLKKNILVSNNISIRDAMSRLDGTGENCLLVIKNKSILLGTLTDGDLRRAILNNISINSSINKIYNKKYSYLVEANYKLHDVKKILLEKKIDIIPIINKKKERIDYHTWDEIFKEEKLLVSKFKKAPKVVIMAGGKGVRLKPFTDILPKPLMPIGDDTVIEKIIMRFNNYGIFNFYITTNYKSNIIKSYLNDSSKINKFSFVQEKSPLGTAGSLEKLKNKIRDSFILTNCDTLVDINFKDLIDFHELNKFSITIVASIKDFQIPYGVCEIDSKQKLKKINEKPVHNILVNTGIYIVNPHILKYIKKDENIDLTSLIERIKKLKYSIGVYPILDKSWIDIGQWTEYKEALQHF